MNRDSKKNICECGGEMKDARISRTIPLAGRRIRVEDVPGTKCEKCGEIYFDGPTLMKLESKLLKQPVLT